MDMTRGIYVTAFGKPARDCAERLLTSIRKFLPGMPVCFCGSEPLADLDPHLDVFVVQPDSDIGARGAKLLAYDLTPPAWDAVLYLDADTEVISSDLTFYFDLLEDGWEFVICKDPMREDVAQLPRQKYDAAELLELENSLGTLHMLMLNGGVWAFARTDAVRGFFTDWLLEWEKFGRRDQGALLRALHKNPLRMMVLGNEWNYFPAYSSRITQAAALMHYPGQARRWGGQVPGRLDGEGAWDAVKKFGQVLTQRHEGAKTQRGEK